MRLFMYSIFDSASGVYDRPFALESDKVAERVMCDFVANKETTVGRHPKDFAMVRLDAGFDDRKGCFVADTKETIITGLEAVARSFQADLSDPSLRVIQGDDPDHILNDANVKETGSA